MPSPLFTILPVGTVNCAVALVKVSFHNGFGMSVQHVLLWGINDSLHGPQVCDTTSVSVLLTQSPYSQLLNNILSVAQVTSSAAC